MKYLLQYAVDFREEISQQLLSVLKLVGHALVADVSVLMVVRQSPTRKLVLLGWLHRMGVVITKNTFTVRLT